MQRIEITEPELLSALQEALGDRPSEDGYTCRELGDITHWGKDKVRRNIEKLIIEGAWERVHLVRTSELDGVTRTIRGYRPVVPSD